MDDAEVIVDPCVAREQPSGIVETDERRIEPSQTRERYPATAMRRGDVRLQRRCTLIVLDGFLISPELAQGIPKIDAHRRVRRLQLDRRCNEASRILHLAHACQSDTQQVQSVAVAWLALEQSAKSRRRLG